MSTSKEREARMKAKMKIKKLEQSFIRGKWGNLEDCYWNEMIIEEIEKLEKDIKW